MRFRVSLGTLLLVTGSFALPLAAHAGIPFFGPIINQSWVDPVTGAQCATGWGALITVVNNVIELFLTLAIVFVAPLMIAWAGFLFVVNPVNASGKEQAKKILLNTVIGIIIALAGWMIVDAVMAVLYVGSPGSAAWGTWSSLVTSGNSSPCLQQAGAPSGPSAPAAPVTPSPTVSVACPAPLTSPPFTDSLAQQMEDGLTVVWDNTDSRLQPCVRKFIGLIGAAGSARVTSAYRPQAYQAHLREIWDRWCAQNLRSNASPSCSSLKSTVSAEVTKHFGSSWSCGSVGATSRHTSGTGVDISGINQRSMTVVQAAAQSCLTWQNYPGDPYHYDLNTSCSYTCN